MRTSNNTIVQSNTMIEGRGNWGVMENRIYYSIIKRIDTYNDEINEDTKISFPVVEFIKEWELSKGNTFKKLMENIAKITEVMFIESKYDKKGELCERSSIPFFSEIKISKSTGLIEAVVNNRLNPHYIGVKREFTKLDFGILTKLKTGTAQLLYEVLSEYKGIGNRVASAREIESLIKPRNCGILQPYEKIYKIDEKLVRPAIEEINKNTDLNITYEKFGRGENTYFEFSISELKTEKPQKENKTQKQREEVIEVIEYLNDKTGHRYSKETEQAELKTRIKETSVDTCLDLIDFKYADWSNWSDRDKYLSPKTLFSKKNFYRYLEEMKARSPYTSKDVDETEAYFDAIDRAIAEGKSEFIDAQGNVISL